MVVAGMHGLSGSDSDFVIRTAIPAENSVMTDGRTGRACSPIRPTSRK